MVQAIRKRVRVGAGGVIELRDPALTEGADAEVIVLLSAATDDALPPLSLADIVGIAPSGRTAEEIDAELRALRDEWDRDA